VIPEPPGVELPVHVRDAIRKRNSDLVGRL
jgi:hypothetical protein